jgi:hypothetical protein
VTANASVLSCVALASTAAAAHACNALFALSVLRSAVVQQVAYIMTSEHKLVCRFAVQQICTMHARAEHAYSVSILSIY